MKEMFLILLGIFIGRYVIDILDQVVSWVGLLTQQLNNIQTLKTTEIQCMIDEMGANKVDDGNRIGFQVASEEDYYYEEEED